MQLQTKQYCMKYRFRKSISEHIDESEVIFTKSESMDSAVTTPLPFAISLAIFGKKEKYFFLPVVSAI